MTIREFLWNAIWAAFLDDNDWWIKAKVRFREEPPKQA